ncbi:hypothetical protein Dsin_026926 [Dipteronia sinensis]|uniref:Transmembrane protein 45B n=1 Tax=Dipteronia sinensis TaxID=43782 RepID=A0AAE0DYK3_9ROSI|nr:hypothetical protein Dsin_026926 [Dipteronia sinensis]
MGTFLGHLVPGLALALLGLWHTINTIRDYCLKGSSNFKVRFWFPFSGPLSKLKHLELFSILSFSFFAILLQVLDFPIDFPYVRFTLKLDNSEHATIFLHLAIFSCFTLCADLSHSFDILSVLPGILAASVFGQELFLIHFHSADHVGIEGHYHLLFQIIVFISLVAALSAACFPTNFLAALILSISVVFQGCWFVNMGFVLWDPQFVPRGCTKQLAEAINSNMHGAVICGSHEADFRARALANLQFSWILSGIWAVTGSIFLISARKYARRNQSIEYEQLHSKVSDVSMAIYSLN